MAFGEFDGCRVKQGPNYISPFLQAAMRRREAEREDIMAQRGALLSREARSPKEGPDVGPRGPTGAQALGIKGRRPTGVPESMELGRQLDAVMRANNVLLRDAAAILGLGPQQARTAWRQWKQTQRNTSVKPND